MNRLICLLLVGLLQITASVAATFKLNVEVTPQGSGSLNTSDGIYEEGASVYLRTYNNTGYVFKGWYDGGELVSSATGFNYTMPTHDVRLQAKYEFDPSVPGNPSMPDTTTYYKLTATVSPNGAGSLNTYEGRYAYNANVSMRTYGNTGYRFLGWKNEEGSMVSSSTSFNYTMPRRDSQLMALYEYDPAVPANPDSLATNYTVYVKCKPIGGGSFNNSSFTAGEGSGVRIYAYTNTGYRFIHWEDESGKVIATDQNFYYVIPHGNSTVYGVFEYDPAVPGNPNKNYWNKELGEVIVDDFTPGSLGGAVSAVISGSDRSDVAMITVAGKMNDNDFGIANDYTNCTLLDLSRVTGITTIPSYAFDYTNLESVYLPATIEKIGYRAFYECKQLMSLTIYAMVPPTLESDVFTGVQDGMVVYVPAAAIAQYQDADGWKDFTILPIQEDIRSISISLPEGANPTDYAQMWLELTNTKSGQKMHYVMTERTSYTFANIIRNTSWNAILRNQRGDVFGKIDGIDVKDEDVTISFTSLEKPQNVSLSVLTPDGTDVTSQPQVTWLDANGNYLAQSTGLTGLLTGNAVSYKVTLSQELAMQYVAPQQTNYVVSEDNNSIQFRLENIKQVILSGCVKDLSTKIALNGSTVTASQTFGGKYSKTLSTKTDAKGLYTLAVSNVPTSLAISATDYISQTIACDSLMTGVDVVSIPDVSLKGISGAVVSLGLSYTKCPSTEEDEDTFQDWYADYNNITYTIFNRTKQKTISQFNVQYPQIVLLEEVDEGDVLEMTASSKTNAFMPVKTTATIDTNQHANAVINIVELGKIKATFTRNSNAAVVGSLYDSKGKLLKSYDYNDASLTISELVDGAYTLVSMGSSKLFNSIYDLSQLPQTGFVLDVDYTQSSVEVNSGKVTAIDIDEVPTLDESKLYYTGDNTSFTVNKSSIVAGNYLTLTGHLDFKSAYATSVSNVNLIVDLPESCEFVENSVMVGNSTSSYTLQNNRITIPLTRYTDRVRFCIIPTLGGEYAPSALAQFDIEGETVIQPIGSANYTAKDLSISVPSTVAKTTIPVSGTAIGKSDIEIYDGNVLIGQTKSLANGTWSTTCELNEPYNLSTHNIFANLTTKAGLELITETVNCLYDKNAIEVNTVTMINTAHTSSNLELYDYVTVFDFQNPKESYPAYWYWPNYPDFTFLVDFTNNDTTIVKNVVLYVFTDHNDIVTLYPEYDAKKDKFVATSKFDSYSLPYNVSVDYISEADVVCSRELLNNSFVDAKAHNSENDEFEKTISDLLKAECDTLSIEIEKLIDNMYGYVYDYESKPDIPDDEILASAKSTFSAINQRMQEREENKLSGSKHIDEYVNIDLSEIGENGRFVTTTCDNLKERDLKQMGYEAIQVDDNTSVYVKYSDSDLNYVDFTRNLHLSISFAEGDNTLNAKQKVSGNDNIAKIRDYIGKINRNINTMENWANVIKGILDELTSGLNSALGDVALDLQMNNKHLAGLANFMERHSGNLDDWNSAKASYDELLQQRKQLRTEQSALKSCKSTLAKAVSKITSVFGLIQNMYKFSQELQKYVNLYYSVPICECNPALSDDIKSEIARDGVARGLYYFQAILSDVAAVHSAYAGVVAAPASGGTSISVTAAAVSWVVIQIGINAVVDKINANVIKKLQNKIDDLYNNSGCWICTQPKPKPCPTPNPPTPPGGGVPNVKDPSGYVYEGVASNRVQGVTATAYYKEMVEDMYGDLHENIVKWDAEEYAQENPLFTDENGMYAWDVPNGLWQVKFENEGYETTYSEWLPVPPPQLDINIEMKQNIQPSVKNARAYEDAVEVEFDKYMMPELLNTENVIVMVGDKQVEGSVEMLNEEVKYEGETETFASKLRFNAKTPFEGSEVNLLVNNRVKSYAGIRMQDNYSQSFTIEKELRKIVCDSVINIIYGDTVTVPVSVLPAEASAGKKLNVHTSSNIIVSVDENELQIDNEGKAYITIIGGLPGTSSLTFTVEDSKIKASSIVNVVFRDAIMVKSPEASIASGTTVEKGTEVTLTCTTEGATIYYTTDGSCPCDLGTAKVYDGPIVINETVTIKAIAVKQNMYDSEITEFTYIVDNNDAVESINVDNDLKIYPLPIRDKVTIYAGGKTINKVSFVMLNGNTAILVSKPANEIQIDAHALTPGVYVVNVETNDKIYHRKVIKAE